jgi:hypothetical protein
MKFNPQKIEPKAENPFGKDLLNRKQYADVLTRIIKNTEDGFTLSINADWGYGKTTFVKMWDAMLQSEGYKTIYFNAWESDFVADPMMALIDGLRSGFEEQDLPQEKLQFSKAFWTVATKLVKLVPQWQVIGEVAEIFQDGIKECLEDKDDLQKSLSIKKLVNDFREQLAKSAKDIGGDKPLIIFVDELDRCRPDYAVHMLERIKHFFAIDNIIFVLSVDKKVLCKSIKAVYGGLKIDTEAYLRRFVDIEFDLPEPQIDLFAKALFDQKEIGEYFTNYYDVISGEHREERLKDTLIDCFLSQSNSLRDVEKYFNRLEIILNSQALPHASADLIAYLLYLYMFHREVYQELRQMDSDVPNMWGSLVLLINTPHIDKTSDLYRRLMWISLECIASYINDKDAKEGYNNKEYASMREGNGLEWFPEEYRKWLVQELTSHRRARLNNLCPHMELINARFDVRRAE